ncbi:hypothetical protein NQZ68_004817 [Dissostichus eleginoides]|nr:hypothetical protein NQZ68_004817 [Dissostichus eleginoides]
MPVRQKDAQRALELLQQYRTKLDQRQQNQSRSKQGGVEEDSQLQQSLDRVINVFQSQLFSALLDIQEYYELTILGDSDSSVDQPAGPWSLPDSYNPPAEPSPQPQPPSVTLSPPASEGSSPLKPLSPKPRSIKSHAAPLPSGTPTSKPSSPTTQSVSPESQPAKLKYRAPLPPVQSGVSKSLASDSLPSSPSAATSPGAPVNALNGTKPQLTATNSNVSVASSTSSTIPQSDSTSPDPNLTTVSALVSSTIESFVFPISPDKLTPKSGSPVTSPGPIRVTDAVVVSTSPVTTKDSGFGKVTPSTSPSSPNQGKFSFSSRSPRSPTGPLTKGLHLSPTSPGPVKVTSTSPSHGPASPRPATSPLIPNKARPEGPNLFGLRYPQSSVR